MIDRTQLTEALAKHDAGTHSPKDIHDLIEQAARLLLDFPTDEQRQRVGYALARFIAASGGEVSIADLVAYVENTLEAVRQTMIGGVDD